MHKRVQTTPLEIISQKGVKSCTSYPGTVRLVLHNPSQTTIGTAIVVIPE